MCQTVARVFFAAVLISASNAVAKEPACNPEIWKESIAKFEQVDEKTPPRPGGVLFVGSSSIRLWKLSKSFPELEPVNRGFGGSTICDATHFFDTLVLKHRPRVVVFYAGDNDVTVGKSAEQVHSDFCAFWKKLHQALPKTRLVYIAIKPSTARWNLAPAMKDANERIAADCKSNEQLTFVDIWQPMLGEDGRPRHDLFLDDGLHMNDKGYEIWASFVLPHIAKKVAKR